MPARAHLLRQLHIVQRLQAVRGRALLFSDIRQYLLAHPSLRDHLGSYELRTFQRDVREIADLFGVTIKSRKNQGYYLAETEAVPAGHEQLLAAVELHEFLRLPAALGAFVQPEARQPLGLAYLEPLLRAAQAGQVVELAYQKYWENTAETRTVGPLLIKEFRGRWYVLAVMARSGQLACFGLDRIQALHPTADSFSPPAGFDAATYYADAFGITRPAEPEEVQEVVLSFTAQQGRYVLGCPLHHSQRVLAQDENEIRLALTVFDTHELRMELLSYGPEVEVVAPATLREWLRAQHRAAAIFGT